MNDLERTHEMLTILMEECGEAIQAASKCIRFNEEKDYQRLEEELGDVLCMIEMINEDGLILWENLDKRTIVKRERLKKWSGLID
jgi:NTP pyrophosphatase (non-canonical NTP hydrolase)